MFIPDSRVLSFPDPHVSNDLFSDLDVPQLLDPEFQLSYSEFQVPLPELQLPSSGFKNSERNSNPKSMKMVAVVYKI